MSSSCIVKLLQLVGVVVVVVHGAPVGMNDDSESVAGGNNGDGPGAALAFLRRFGYLEALGTNASETLYSEERVTEAIRLMQHFAALPETGKLDNDTLALLTKRRCGVPDVVSKNSTHSETRRKKRFALGSSGWNKRKLSYRLENWSPKLGSENVHFDLNKAMQVWGKYAHLTFINKTDPHYDKVDISISFGSRNHGDRFPFDGEGGILAHAFFPQNMPGLSGDIHFDLDEDWYHHQQGTSRPTRGVSFIDVAIHEFGHSLGIAHSPDRDSVMFPYYKAPSTGEPELGHDDIMALYHLYITKTLEDGDADNEDEPTSGTTTTTTSTPTTRPFTDEPSTSTATPIIPTTTTVTTPTISGEPDICKGEYDSIAFIRNELFVFRGEYMWRWMDRGQLSGGGYPTHTSRLFPLLRGVKKVDAAFEKESDGSIVFISGRNYWTYSGDHSSDKEISHQITEFGLPHDLEGVDAAFVWGKNRMTYFFKDDEYWRYNETAKSVKDANYPASIKDRWRGISGHVTSVITYRDGKTYFFKGDEFWRFDDIHVQTEDNFPMNTGRYWFGCT